MLLKLHQQLDDGLESLLGIQREVLQHQLKYFYMLSVSVILQSISDVNCTQGVGFLLIIFYCRIIHTVIKTVCIIISVREIASES